MVKRVHNMFLDKSMCTCVRATPDVIGHIDAHLLSTQVHAPVFVYITCVHMLSAPVVVHTQVGNADAVATWTFHLGVM